MELKVIQSLLNHCILKRFARARITDWCFLVDRKRLVSSESRLADKR